MIFLAPFSPFGPESARSFGADIPLEDPKNEARARALFQNIRCLVCQNQSIDDSGSELARDLRNVIRDQVQSGLSNDKILEFMVDRYGAWVLLEPPPENVLLWSLPAIISGCGLIGMMIFWRTHGTKRDSEEVSDFSLTPEDQARLDTLAQHHNRTPAGRASDDMIKKLEKTGSGKKDI